MRNHPYVVVISGSPSEAELLMSALDDLEIPSFFPERDVHPGENSAERIRTELNRADAVLVGTKPQQVEFKEEDIRLRKSMDPAFKIIPVVAGSKTPAKPPDWFPGVQPLIYYENTYAETISSLVKSLIPERQTEPQETLDELLAEAELLALRLQFAADQYRHSLIVLGISLVVVFSGGLLVLYGVAVGAGNQLSGFYQFFGLVVVVLGGFFLFHSIVRWSSSYQRSLLSRRLLKEGSWVISASKSFLQGPAIPQAASRQPQSERYDEGPRIL